MLSTLGNYIYQFMIFYVIVLFSLYLLIILNIIKHPIQNGYIHYFNNYGYRV